MWHIVTTRGLGRRWMRPPRGEAGGAARLPGRRRAVQPLAAGNARRGAGCQPVHALRRRAPRPTAQLHRRRAARGRGAAGRGVRGGSRSSGRAGGARPLRRQDGGRAGERRPRDAGHRQQRSRKAAAGAVGFNAGFLLPILIVREHLPPRASRLRPDVMQPKSFLAGVLLTLALSAAVRGAYLLGRTGSDKDEAVPPASLIGSTSTPPPTSTPRPSPTPEIVHAAGASSTGEEYLCPGGFVTITSTEKRQVMEFWNDAADIWNAIVNSMDAFALHIPDPFTYDNARASSAFRQAAAQHLQVLNSEITISSLNSGNVELWNSTVGLEARRDEYYERAAAEIRAMCSYLGFR